MSRLPAGAPASAAESAATTQPHRSGGAAYALLAYTIWGVAPAYFVWVGAALPFEILAHRVLWSIPLLALLLTFTAQWRVLFGLDLRTLAALFVSGALIGANWGVFIWAVDAGKILETSLGYYLNPLINVVFGVLLLRERLRLVQWMAVTLAALGVANEVWYLGSLPWYGLLLAITFALYGLVRKITGVGPVVGLAVETALIGPLALAYLIWIHTQALSVTAGGDFTLLWMLALGGLVTIVPLLCFTAAALRMPLSILGFFQYLAPTLSLLLAVFVYDEAFRAHQFVTFGLIWLALAAFSMEGWWHTSNNRRV
ncbi:MAG: EamA family transporter RarD [Pseudomonadales bacterium]